MEISWPAEALMERNLQDLMRMLQTIEISLSLNYGFYYLSTEKQARIAEQIEKQVEVGSLKTKLRKLEVAFRKAP